MSIVEPVNGYFPITAIHRADVMGTLKEPVGVELDDDFMRELAEKMEDDYLNQMFWSSLEIIATEMLEDRRKQ